jgi:hypothetical protein
MVLGPWPTGAFRHSVHGALFDSSRQSITSIRCSSTMGYPLSRAARDRRTGPGGAGPSGPMVENFPGMPVPDAGARSKRGRTGRCWAARSFLFRTLGLKFLSSTYLQLIATGLLLSITIPAASWGPQAVNRATTMPGPAERTALVQCRHLQPTAPLTVPDSPCLIAAEPKPASPHGNVITVHEVPSVFQSFHSSLLANRAPPSAQFHTL